MSFKEKMENLHDPTSTNLYMEGLPLSIDEATLSALVSPHRISSSRFFQTRLSNPPRIIAFVRLETRVGAEEVIERLHGRMVRGWNDAGSRISVRFADTAEQRELRRTERANKDGEPSPSRLTIAQAALLNMRGQDLRQRHTPMLPSHQSLPDRLGRLDHALYTDFVPSTRRSPTGLTVDFPPDAEYISPGMRRSVSSPYPHPLSLQHIDSSHKVDPSVLTLLDSLRGSRPFPGGDYAAREHELQYNIGPRVSHRSSQILEDLGYTTQQYPLRNGYTPTEEYIMRAHAESAAQRRRPPPLDLYRRRRDNEANITMGVRGHRAPITLQPKVFVQSDEFQASAVTNELRSRAEQLEICPETTLRPPQANARVPRDSVQSKQSLQPQVQQSVQSSEAHQVGHTRSSTLPHRSTFPNQHQRHYQHNSMSVASATSGAHSQDAISAILNSINQNSSISTSRNKAIHHDTADDHATNDHKEISQLTNSNRLSYDNTKGSARLEYRNARLVRDSSAGIEVEQPSPSLTSPALTYSSQTPSTLSPVTPFVGSFASQEGFEQSGVEVKRAKVKQ
ncbi:hypothetical protein M378DRAFT_378564 [Amanita muscaria Koide BX008]|uniref:RRM domain-containing protein n=1 Tax=Amanita muscaria (strain Koide BX008) TaxID=946122 RepID=A0A0C2S4K9_AMAMK|nr:hypothetical protein M378DRAFT_378564 [Amanita muscaria Koide BX008]